MRYIMVTHWDNHWDKLPNKRTLFTKSMFRDGMDSNSIAEQTDTIFIKKTRDSRKFEKSWSGKVYNFKTGMYRSLDAMYFNVAIDREITCPSEYLDYVEGWYCEKGISDKLAQKFPIDNIITEDKVKKITLKNVLEILSQLSIGAVSLIISFLIALFLIFFKIGYWFGSHK